MSWLAAPFVDPASRTFWAWWLPFLVIALGVTGRGFVDAVLRPLWHRSSWLDVQLLVGRQLLRALGVLPAFGAAFGIALATARLLRGLGFDGTELPRGPTTLAYTLVLFVAWDLSRYLLHRWMHTVPALWAIHQVHHSAEVLTPLTFHRVHPFASVLYSLRNVVVTGLVTGVFHALCDGVTAWTLFGVAGIGVVANATMGNLRHSHVHVPFGRFERVLMSPAQHQLHHVRDGGRCNYGTWLSVWDRLGGTWAPSAGQRTDFGLADPHHEHDLLSAWLAPFVAWMPRRARVEPGAHARSGLDRCPPAP